MVRTGGWSCDGWASSTEAEGNRYGEGGMQVAEMGYRYMEVPLIHNTAKHFYTSK